MSLRHTLEQVLTEPLDIARAALVVARLEYPDLSPIQSLDALDRLGDRAGARLAGIPAAQLADRVIALNRLLYDEEGFAGNRAHYDDFRNSCLNAVLDRRLGIPITLALVYMEVARRAGLDVLGVGFPGHFLMRVQAGAEADDDRDLILDPFGSGATLDEEACRRLLSRHSSDAHDVNEDVPLDRSLLRPCTSRHMLARMLNNLKRTYVELRCFPQARMVTDLLLAVDPTLIVELRDRGLLAYHLDDFPSALRDLEAYLQFSSHTDNVDQDERKQIWEHVKNLRRRVAGLN
jgi:regulator of sirC expression with transglutaminase-like and TPR domain